LILFSLCIFSLAFGSILYSLFGSSFLVLRFLITARHGWFFHQPFYKFNPTFHSIIPAGEDPSQGDGITETLEIFLFGFSFILLTALYFFFVIWFYFVFLLWFLASWFLVLD